VKVDNGRRERLEISGVFEGIAGVQGNHVSFVPNRSTAEPEAVKGGILGGKPVLLTTAKDPIGPLYTARFTVVE
jgi:hypothetical protein